MQCEKEVPIKVYTNISLTSSPLIENSPRIGLFFGADSLPTNPTTDTRSLKSQGHEKNCIQQKIWEIENIPSA